jgi:hypothetical protein
MIPRIALLLLLSFCLIAIAACGPDRPFDRDDAPAVDPTPISVSKVLEQPNSYLGQRITLAGDIVEVYSRRAFSMVGEQYLENDALLVIIEQPHSDAERAGVTDLGARVQVTGTLRSKSGDILRTLNLESGLIPEHLSTPVLVADSVSIAKAP